MSAVLPRGLISWITTTQKLLFGDREYSVRPSFLGGDSSESLDHVCLHVDHGFIHLNLIGAPFL